MLGTTELRNENTRHIDVMDTEEMVRVINQEDQKVALAVEAALPQISRAVDAIVAKLRAGGRLIYVGAGTSGRLGVLDAAECIPTYGSHQVVGIIAGGPEAMLVAREGAEDSRELAVKQLQEIGFESKDILCGIAASGRTPFVLGAFEYAHEIGTLAISITNNANSPCALAADIAIEAITGPEVVTGSTRMKAGTADKMILNILSTASMIQLGKVYENLMIDLKVTNLKLVDRAERIIAEISGASKEASSEMLKKTEDVKVSVLCLKYSLPEEKSREILKSARENLSLAMRQIEAR